MYPFILDRDRIWDLFLFLSVIFCVCTKKSKKGKGLHRRKGKKISKNLHRPQTHCISACKIEWIGNCNMPKDNLHRKKELRLITYKSRSTTRIMERWRKICNHSFLANNAEHGGMKDIIVWMRVNIKCILYKKGSELMHILCTTKFRLVIQVR